MKRTILKKLTACLCLCAVLSGALTVPAGAASFQDVPSNHWAATAIDRCAAQGWFQGKTADTFGVGQPMTRAGFAVALSRFFGWQSGETYYRIFSDVPQGAWYEPALRACYEHGAVTRQTGDFRPGDPITREELAVMLIRALGYGPIAGLAEDDPLPFRDVTTNRGYIALAYEMGLVKNRYIGRTFIQPSQAMREKGVKMKLSAVRSLVAGKRVALIDDSIVRGTTSLRIVRLLKAAGAKEVHVRIASPKMTHPCFYGVDTSTCDQLIGHRCSVEEICRQIEADSLAFLSEGALLRAGNRKEMCMACFTGRYPTALYEHAAEIGRKEDKNR